MAKNCKAVSQRIFRTIERISGYLVITRSTGNDCMKDKRTWLSIGVYRWKGIAKEMGTRVSKKQRKVSSESSGEVGDHLD